MKMNMTTFLRFRRFAALSLLLLLPHLAAALEWYEKYLRRAKPGTRGYEFAQQSVAYLKGELFMEEE